MPPGGVHLSVGVGVVRWVLPVLPRVVPARHGHALRAAAVFGSIVPDFDLLLTSAAVALTNDKSYIDTLHRTASHSLPIFALLVLLAVWRLRWRARHAPCVGRVADSCDARGGHSSPHLPPPGGDPLLWRLLLKLAGASACDKRAGDSVAAVLGVAAGAVCHVLADIFYIVPVELLWPLPHKFSYPLLLPAREHFTPRLYKLAMLGDFLSDNFYIVPVLYVCWYYKLHEDTWRRFALFWAFQSLVIVAHLHPALMDDRYDHEDFIYWLFCPCGCMFMCVLNLSPLLLPDAIRLLAFPKEGPAALEAAQHRLAKQVPHSEPARAHSGVGDAGQAVGTAAAESPASSGASAPSEPSPDSVLPQPLPASPLPPRSLCFGRASVSGEGGSPLRQRRRYAASAGALNYGGDDECSSPARRTRSDARLGAPHGSRTP